MDWIIFAIIWGVGSVFILMAPLMLFVFRRPEYGVKLLRSKTVAYWWLNLKILVPKPWVKPIRKTVFLGIIILATDILLLVISQSFDLNIKLFWPS